MLPCLFGACVSDYGSMIDNGRVAGGCGVVFDAFEPNWKHNINGKVAIPQLIGVSS